MNDQEIAAQRAGQSMRPMPGGAYPVSPNPGTGTRQNFTMPPSPAPAAATPLANVQGLGPQATMKDMGRADVGGGEMNKPRDFMPRAGAGGAGGAGVPPAGGTGGGFFDPSKWNEAGKSVRGFMDRFGGGPGVGALKLGTNAASSALSVAPYYHAITDSAEDGNTMSTGSRLKALGSAAVDGVGALAGGTIGGAVGSLAGPVGTFAGGVGGGIAGRAAFDGVGGDIREMANWANEKLGGSPNYITSTREDMAKAGYSAAPGLIQTLQGNPRVAQQSAGAAVVAAPAAVGGAPAPVAGAPVSAGVAPAAGAPAGVQQANFRGYSPEAYPGADADWAKWQEGREGRERPWAAALQPQQPLQPPREGGMGFSEQGYKGQPRTASGALIYGDVNSEGNTAIRNGFVADSNGFRAQQRADVSTGPSDNSDVKVNGWISQSLVAERSARTRAAIDRANNTDNNATSRANNTDNNATTRANNTDNNLVSMRNSDMTREQSMRQAQALLRQQDRQHTNDMRTFDNTEGRDDLAATTSGYDLTQKRIADTTPDIDGKKDTKTIALKSSAVNSYLSNKEAELKAHIQLHPNDAGAKNELRGLSMRGAAGMTDSQYQLVSSGAELAGIAQQYGSSPYNPVGGSSTNSNMPITSLRDNDDGWFNSNWGKTYTSNRGDKIPARAVTGNGSFFGGLTNSANSRYASQIEAGARQQELEAQQKKQGGK